jgi:hypothetical protein
VIPVWIVIALAMGGGWFYERLHSEMKEWRDEALRQRRQRVLERLRRELHEEPDDDLLMSMIPAVLNEPLTWEEASYHATLAELPARAGRLVVEEGATRVDDSEGGPVRLYPSWDWRFYLPDEKASYGYRLTESGTAPTELEAQEAAEAWFRAAVKRGFFPFRVLTVDKEKRRRRSVRA